MERVSFDLFEVEVPAGWGDITGTIEADNLPDTLAHRDGVGALQFSVALHRAGPVPDPTPAVLREMVEMFGRNRGPGEPAAVVVESGPPALAAGTFILDQDFLRVWQVSEGGNFAFVTYTCAGVHSGSELEECERIVRSTVFKRG